MYDPNTNTTIFYCFNIFIPTGAVRLLWGGVSHAFYLLLLTPLFVSCRSVYVNLSGKCRVYTLSPLHR